MDAYGYDVRLQGEDSKDTMEAAHYLAHCLVGVGRFAGAISHLEVLVPRNEAYLGPESLVTKDAKNLLDIALSE